MCVNACKLHAFTDMPAAMRNIQGRTNPKRDALTTSPWSWSNPTPAKRKYPPKFTVSPPCSSLLTINPDWAVRREGRVQQGRWGVVVTSEGPSSAPSCLHPCRLLGGMESKFVVELQSWGWRRLCYERGSVCVLRCLREKFRTFHRRSSRFPILLLLLWLMLDAERVFNQPGKTGWIDYVATYYGSVFEIKLFCLRWAGDIQRGGGSWAEIHYRKLESCQQGYAEFLHNLRWKVSFGSNSFGTKIQTQSTI